MSTIKIRNDNKWESLYGNEINYYSKNYANLSDLESRQEARENLGISGDVTSHNHNSRYNPLIDAESGKRSSGDAINRSTFDGIKNDMASVLTPEQKTQLVNSINKLSSDIDNEISVRTSADNTLMNNFKTSLNAAQKTVDDSQMQEVTTTGTNIASADGTVSDKIQVSKINGILTEREFSIKKGAEAGKYKLDLLLTQLAKISHFHENNTTTSTKKNCDCNDSRCCGR